MAGTELPQLSERSLGPRVNAQALHVRGQTPGGPENLECEQKRRGCTVLGRLASPDRIQDLVSTQALSGDPQRPRADLDNVL